MVIDRQLNLYLHLFDTYRRRMVRFTMLCSLQGLHSVVLTGTLGRPLICPERGISNLSADTLYNFARETFCEIHNDPLPADYCRGCTV